VNNATDFFEHSLNEAFASGELNDSAGKSRLVSRIAPPLALVQDAVLRETLLGRIASRLGLPQPAIRVAMKAPAIDQDETQAQEAQKDEELTLSRGMKTLCLWALTSQEVRSWLRTQNRLDDFEPGAVLVTKLAQADFEDDAPLPPTLLAQLTGAEARTLARLEVSEATRAQLMSAKGGLISALERVIEDLQGFHAQKLKREIDELTSRIANPAITADERQKIQKQILDLTIRVADVRRPFLQA
jgi:DNA primase